MGNQEDRTEGEENGEYSGGARGSGEKEDSEGEEEGQESKGLNAPTRPSQEELDDHMRTHIPFRSWCPHCVKGQGQNQPHKQGQGESGLIPIVCMDYMFMNSSGKEPKEGEEEEKGMPTLVIKDESTKVIEAHIVPRKGGNNHAITTVVNVLNSLGHKKIILKSDQEPSIMKLKEAVKREFGENI